MKAYADRLKTVLGGLMLCLLAACASAPPTDAALDKDIRVSLPAPHLASPLHLQQLLTARVHGEAKGQTLLAVLDADDGRLSLIGFSLLGVRLFRIDYDAQGIRTEQLPMLASLGALPPASQVLADIMLAYWPVADWQARLPTGWQLVDAPLRRELRDNAGRLVSEITYQQQGAQRVPVQLWQHAFDYQLSIQTLPATGAAGGHQP